MAERRAWLQLLWTGSTGTHPPVFWEVDARLRPLRAVPMREDGPVGLAAVQRHGRGTFAPNDGRRRVARVESPEDEARAWGARW